MKNPVIFARFEKFITDSRWSNIFLNYDKVNLNFLVLIEQYLKRYKKRPSVKTPKYEQESALGIKLRDFISNYNKGKKTGIWEKSVTCESVRNKFLQMIRKYKDYFKTFKE